jgi:heptosyltransferase III
MMNTMVRRILIYRLGSIGDTIVALPCLHLIARSFPSAERRLLTNIPVNMKAAAMADVLGRSNLVHGYFTYPIGTRDIGRLWKLRMQIADWSPDMLIYLAKPRGQVKIFRDSLFFYLCGIRKIIGMPYLPSMQNVREINGNELYESEAHRLSRCLQGVGYVDLDDPANWDLLLSRKELMRADQILHDWRKDCIFLSASIGTKVDTKRWGVENWRKLLAKLSNFNPNLGLVLIGSQDERILSDEVAIGWNGPKKNLCGNISPRVSAAVVGKSILFIGHDSGPMHLAASMQVPCVAIFRPQTKPGEWFPWGKNHSVIYHHTDRCSGGLMQGIGEKNRSIMAIAVDDVFAVALKKIQHVSQNKYESIPRRNQQDTGE